MPIIPFSSRSDTELLQIIAGALVDPVTLEPIPIAGVVAFSDITGNPSDNSALDAALDAKAPLISPAFTTPDIGAAMGDSLNATGVITSDNAGYGNFFVGSAGAFARVSNLGGGGLALNYNTGNSGSLFYFGGSTEPVLEVGSLGDLVIANSFSVGGGTPITLIKSATATLDFPSTPAGTISLLTIALTEAAVGDVIELGVPAAAMANGGSFGTPWVSSAGVITIPFVNNDLVAVIDPPSGTFRVAIKQF